MPLAAREGERGDVHHAACLRLMTIRTPSSMWLTAMVCDTILLLAFILTHSGH